MSVVRWNSKLLVLTKWKRMRLTSPILREGWHQYTRHPRSQLLTRHPRLQRTSLIPTRRHHPTIQKPLTIHIRRERTTILPTSSLAFTVRMPTAITIIQRGTTISWTAQCAKYMRSAKVIAASTRLNQKIRPSQFLHRML